MAHIQEKYFVRLNLFQRLQHWILAGSFTLLTITGLPMRFLILNGLASFTIIGELRRRDSFIVLRLY